MKRYIFIALLQIVCHGFAHHDATKWQNSLRIIGGGKASHRDNPSMGSLWRDGDPFCGCSIINSYHLLTAAHCFEDTSSGRYKVVVGALNVFDYETDEHAKAYSISHIYIHENYTSVENAYDIAIIRTSTPIKFIPFYVKAAKLPQTGQDLCDTATVWGWGATSEKDLFITDYLHKVDVEKIPHRTCALNYNQEGYTIYKSLQLCYGDEYGEKDSCVGDSGGALTCKNYPYYQIGLVSFGIGCAQAKFPGVYTRLSVHYDWILSKTTISRRI